MGSLVKLGFDSHGEIIAINVVYSPDGSAGLISADNPESEGTINSGSRMVYAEIVKQDGDFMQVRFEKNKQERTEFIPLADIPVLICEEGNSGLDIQKTGVSALIAGRKAIFILDYGRALQAIVYK